MIPIYRPYLSPQTENVYDYWMDGVRMISFENKIHLIGGWNGDQPTPLHKTHLTSDDEGVTWDIITESAPWAGRHTHGIHVTGGKIYIWGGNDVMDIWSYTTAGGWVEEASSGSIGQRDHFSCCGHGEYGYVLGGNISNLGTTAANDCWRVHLPTQVWTKMGDLPAGLQATNSGCMGYFKGDLYHFGGGKYNVNAAPNINNINQKAFKSTDNGATWTEIADTAVLNSFLWGDAVFTSDVIIAISGSDVTNSVFDNNRMIYSTDCITWREFPIKITGRHATAIAQHGNDVFIGMGFGMNDFWKIKRLASKYKTYL